MSYGGRLEAYFTVPSGVTISVTNNGGGPTAVTIAAGEYAGITEFCSYLQTALTTQRAPSGGSWSVSVSTGASGTGLVTIAMSSGTFSITWTSTEARDLLGFASTITTQTSATGTLNARGLWLPKCPVTVAGRISSSPLVTDARATEGPTGEVTTIVGTYKYKHREISWSHVTADRVNLVDETTTHASWHSWIRDTQLGLGHSWFSPGSGFKFYWDNAGTDTLVGADLPGGAGPTGGWKCSPAISRMDPERVSQGWDGMWRVSIASIVGVGDTV